MDVEKETDYEKSLWAMFATDEANHNEPTPSDNRRSKRKRQHDSQDEDPNAEEPQGVGPSHDEPERKKKKTRRTLRKKKAAVPEDDGEETVQGGDEAELTGNALRFAPPGTGRVKSAVYIIDSD